MPRTRRLDYAGAHQHVINRGARRAHIFEVDGARELFLELLSELPMRFGLEIQAYAVMGNHYHLMVRSPDRGLSPALKRLDQTFTQRLNHRMGWDGPVFRGRFHNVLIGNPAHWNHLLAYIHGNPSRAGLAGRLHDPLWTSHGAYLSGGDSARWLSVEPELERLGGVQRYANWLRERIDGTVEPPPNFQPEKAGAGPGSELRAPPRSTSLDTEAAILQAIFVLGSPLSWRRGRERAVAAWWLRFTGTSVAETGARLGISASTVSRTLDHLGRLSETDDEVAAWMACLLGTDPRMALAS